MLKPFQPNAVFNQEGTGEAKKDRGIDPHAYQKGKWYRFLTLGLFFHRVLGQTPEKNTPTEPFCGPTSPKAVGIIRGHRAALEIQMSSGGGGGLEALVQQRVSFVPPDPCHLVC